MRLLYELQNINKNVQILSEMVINIMLRMKPCGSLHGKNVVVKTCFYAYDSTLY